WRRRCADMLKQPAPELMRVERQLIAWTCTLAPDAVKDWQPVLALLGEARNYNDNAPTTINRAAILCRAGRYDEAVRILTGRIPAPDYSPYQKDRQQLFLALACARLGRRDEARAALKAISSVRPEAVGIEQTELALLRREVETALTEAPPA